jgi:hypothetical protein
MKRGMLASLLLAASALFVTSNLVAQNAPPGAIFNLDTVQTTPLTSYQMFSTSFMADNSSEFVSFAFRESPAYFAFDDASVIIQGGSTNLLADPGFESATFGQNCNHNNALGCPSGWGAWIQAVDTRAIGQVATNANSYGCPPNAAHSGTNFWCDGSVQGYDAVYQPLNGLTVGRMYNVTFFLGDNSGVPPNQANEDSQVDMLVYASDSLPVGSIPIGTPEPGTLSLIGAGVLVIGLLRRRRTA